MSSYRGVFLATFVSKRVVPSQTFSFLATAAGRKALAVAPRPGASPPTAPATPGEQGMSEASCSPKQGPQAGASSSGLASAAPCRRLVGRIGASGNGAADGAGDGLNAAIALVTRTSADKPENGGGKCPQLRRFVDVNVEQELGVASQVLSAVWWRVFGLEP